MTRRLIRGIGLLALWSTTALGAGEETLPAPPLKGEWEITPARLVQQVLARNADALYAELQSRVAGHLLEAESALGEPVGFASLRREDRLRQRTAQEKSSTNSIFNIQSELDERVNTLELGVRRRLPTGGDLSLSYRYTDRRNNIIRSTTGQTSEYDGALTLSFKHPLLRGFGSAAVDTDRRVAELELAISRQQYRQQILKSVSESLSAYWQLYKAHELKRMREEAREYARKSLDDAKSQQAVGRASRTAVTEARALLGLRQVEVLRAEQGMAEAEAKVKTLLSLPGQAYRNLRLKPVQDGETVAPAAQEWSEERLQAALEAWPPWKVAQLRRDQGQARLDYARNQTRPGLDMVASCSSTRLAYDSGEVTDNIVTRDYPDCYIGFNLEIPLQGNRRAEGQYQAQAVRINQSDLELEAVRGALANDLLNRSLQWERAVAETAEIKQDVELRRELLEAERTQMGMGLSRLSQVIERENALNESRARLLDSIARQQLAQVGLDLAQGVLLKRHNIEWVE